MKDATPWVVYTDAQVFRCNHCGREYTPALPCPLTLFTAMMFEFVRLHRKCPAPPVARARRSRRRTNQWLLPVLSSPSARCVVKPKC